jgi:hypothetical protein
MCIDPRFAASYIALVFFSGLMPTASGAADCLFLNTDPLQLRDGELLYQRPSDQKWVEVDETSSALANQRISFAYVIQEKFDQGHGGVAVVKSARVRQLDEPALPMERRVDLVRNTDDSAPDACAPVPGSMNTSVPTQSYDDYHDYGRRVPEQTILDTFHYKHAARKGRCLDTNLTDRDPRSTRSNRAQFSFDSRIVSGGYSEQAFYFVTPRSASASSEKLSEQRVEMQAYRVRRGFPSCIAFSITVPARAGIIRINNLDGLKQSGIYNIRADEKSWSLSR